MEIIKSTKDKFIENANIKHNFNFDYSLIDNFNHNKCISIKCKLHNLLINIIPGNHLSQINGGCKECENVKKDIKLKDGEIKKSVNIDEYKDYYWITNFGRCFSKKTNKELKNHIGDGYYKVNLYDINNKHKLFRIHHLVYITFKNDYDNKNIIDHIDGNKLNNILNNLRCISQSNNVKNAYKNNDKMYQKNKIEIYDLENNFIKEVESTEEARIFLNLKSKGPIFQCLKGNYKTTGGYILKYKDNKIIENNKNKYVDNIMEYKSLGIIEDKDFSTYLINEQGVIINTKYNNRKVKTFINDNGYLDVHLYYTTKNKFKFKLHRLIAKIFLDNDNKYYNNNNYVVNHKDKNKLNNNINNLEWITQKENTIHGKGKKIAQIDIKTNETIKIYDSITDAYKELNKPWNSLISKVCLGKKGRNSIYGYKWKYIEE